MAQGPKQRPGGGEKPSGGPDMGRRRGIGGLLLWLLLLFLIAPWIAQWLGLSDENTISYTDFRGKVRAGQVEQVTIKGDTIHGRLKSSTTSTQAAGDTAATADAADGGQPGHDDPQQPAGQSEGGSGAAKGKTFVTYVPSFGDDNLLTLLEHNGVVIHTKPSSSGSLWPLLLVSFLPLLILFGLGYVVYKRMRGQASGGGGLMSMGKSGAKLYEREDGGTTFDDVAGADGAKTELREVIDYLKDPGYSQRLGGKPPRGVLLVGPPGTGKTLLARATAGEAEVPFFSITGSNFMEMFVGVGASRVRNLFKEARKSQPAIVFIDELDSIGRRRGAGLGGGNDEREQTLNQLLSEMDGFAPHESVILIAATNRPDILDPALLRPGRFDRRITVESPTKESRRRILEVHSRDKPLAEEVDLDEVARGTPGFSGADLANLLNEAALLAVRRRKQKVGREDVEEARDKILLGLEREGLVLTEADTRMLAYHEAGHTVVAATVPNADPIHKVSIIPRGRSMGVTQQLPEKDKYVYAKAYLLDRMAVMMGGRAAEELVLETSTSGAESDLKEAVRLARAMVLEWGMSEKLKNLALGGENKNVFLGEQIAQGKDYSETTAREVDEEVKLITGGAFERAAQILKDKRAGLDRLATALMEHEELTGAQALELIGP